MGLRAWARFALFFGPSRVSLLEDRVEDLSTQIRCQQELMREVIREVLQASQAQAVAMQDFVGMVKMSLTLQTPIGEPERRVSTDQSEYEAWMNRIHGES